MGTALAALMVQGAGSAQTAYAQYQTAQFNRAANYQMADSAIGASALPGSAALMRGSQAIGAARAHAASGNVDVQSGSVVDAIAGTRAMSALDAATVRFNALQQAYGLRLRGDLAEREAKDAAEGTLLTGLGSMYKTGYQTIPNFDRGSDVQQNG